MRQVDLQAPQDPMDQRDVVLLNITQPHLIGIDAEQSRICDTLGAARAAASKCPAAIDQVAQRKVFLTEHNLVTGRNVVEWRIGFDELVPIDRLDPSYKGLGRI